MIRNMTRRGLLTVGGSLLAVNQWPFGLPLAAAANVAPATLGKLEPWSSTSPFLSGAFAPVFDERDDSDLKIEGEIPRGLHGVFMRNGPNPQFSPDAHYAYPFDGTGMVHALFLENGRARYSNRWVKTKEVTEERAAGRRIYNSSFSAPPHADLANTNIIRHAGRYLALYEGGVPYELSGTLETVGPFNYDGALPSVMSAHPKQDPITGELLSIAYDARTGAMAYLRADRNGHLDRIVKFQAPWPAMVHDIAITEHHVVAFVCPLVFDRSKPGPPATWQPQRGTQVAVIPREALTSAEVQWIKGAPFFQFHTMNAFAEGKRIEVTVPWYDSFSLTGRASRLELHRLIIHTDTNTFEDQIVDERACEFARINDSHLGRRARFGYVGLRNPRPDEKPQLGAFEAFARYDLSDGTKQVHLFPAGVTVCEPVFVADPRGKGEEDGFIFTFAHDANNPAGLFVILDARNLGREPLATVRLPRRVPAGLHGSWMPA
jgi:carotenoid cleavage dioxygenase-like enzyme